MKKQKLVSAFAQKMKALYRGAGKKARGELLDEFSAMTGYSRKHAMAILRGDFKPSTRRGRRRASTHAPLKAWTGGGFPNKKGGR